MTQTTAAFSSAAEARQAGEDLARQVTEAIQGEPDALVLFASPSHDLQELIHSVHERCRPRKLVGCSSAGEFAADQSGVGAVSALAVRSDEMEFSTCVAENLAEDPRGAVDRFASCLLPNGGRFPNRSILLLTDALAGHTEEFIQGLNDRTLGAYRIFGGGAGDDAKFKKTFVFAGRQVMNGAAVGLEIRSQKPLGIGVRHGWTPASSPMRATESNGFELVSVNAMPAAEVLEEHASRTGQRFDLSDPMPFFLHNVLGVETPSGYKIRVPLGITPAGGLVLAAEVPEGSTVRVMRTTSGSAVAAAAEATQDALGQLGGNRPAAALFFDCVATRLRLGTVFSDELATVRQSVGEEPFVGCNSYGQVARVDGQFSGFHNCTAVVCLIPN